MAQGWSVDATADTITFTEAPPTGTNNVVVKERATADINATAIWSIGAWNNEYGYPGEGEFYSDRLIFAATVDQPQTLWASRIGDYSFFGKSTPIADDDSFTATMNARQLNEIVDLIPKQHLLALTYGGVWKVGGGDAEVLTPSTVSTRPQPSTGGSRLPALDLGETAVYVTHKGGQVRDLAYTFEADGYAGSDLTAFAGHLLWGKQLVDWASAPIPYSAIYAARDDGTLLSLVYKREHQVVAWSRHDTGYTEEDAEFVDTGGASFENVCTLAEDGYHGAYVCVDRTNTPGGPSRYIERFADPGEDWREAVGVDSALTYDGRNTTTTTLLLRDLGAMEVEVEASAASFVVGDVGDSVVVDYYTDTPMYITITDFISSTIVRGTPSFEPNWNLDIHGVDAADWGMARISFTGAGHLNSHGGDIIQGADGRDFSQGLSGGSFSLPSPGGMLVHVGYKIKAEYESLDMMLVGGESVANRNKNIRQVGVFVQDTSKITVGLGTAAMNDYLPVDPGTATIPPAIRTEWIMVDVSGRWEKAPRVRVTSESAYPITVLAMEPQVEMGGA